MRCRKDGRRRMSNESKVIAAAIKSRDAYDSIASNVVDGDLTEQAALIWRVVGDYYERDGNAESCDGELLAAAVCREITSDKHREAIGPVVLGLAASDASPQNVIHDFIAVKREAAGEKLAAALIAGRHNGTTTDLLAEYEGWNNAENFGEDEEQVVRGMLLEDIAAVYDPDELIEVWPSSLNQRLDGGLLRGHHLVVFARPEMGKTMFVVNATAGFLRQGLTVLYIGNEEPLEDIALRIISRLSLKDKHEVFADKDSAYETACEAGYNNLIMAKMYPGSPREIEKLMREYKPDVLVIDQLRNLRMKEDNYVQKLEKAASAARNLGKQHNALVVSVTQAGDSASGKAILDMGDVDSSNTGIPAQADVMVAIGASAEDEEIGRRVLSLPKNKRSGNHDHFPVRIDPTRSRITAIGD
jgi:KaiC/GvpD/RAD55 family RecA-like ATPase